MRGGRTRRDDMAVRLGRIATAADRRADALPLGDPERAFQIAHADLAQLKLARISRRLG